MRFRISVEGTVKRSRLWLAVAAIMVETVSGLSAQTANPQRGTNVHPATRSFGFGPAGLFIPTKANAPFSAVLVEALQDALADGVQINRENESVVMRDGMGRIYRARKIAVEGKARPDAVARVMMTIVDPVERVQYTCTPIRICGKMGYREWPAGSGPQQGPYPPLDATRDRGIRVEELGPATISGVKVEGKRLTLLMPEGAAGNDRAFTSTKEVWHSKELDIDVQVKQTDPRWGTHTATMTQINLDEPDASYFQIPEGYRVEEHQGFPQPQVEPFPPENQ
jgi:hypothetical protein